MSAVSQNQYYSFLPRFYRLASVGVLSNMMIPLAGLCDTAFLGHLNNLRHLAGVILASILFDYLYRILKFLRNSTNAMTSQAVGEKDREGMLLAGLRSGLIAIAIGFLILCLQYPIQKLGFAILGGAQEIELTGIDYFNARIYGAPAVLLNFVLIGWFLGREKNEVVLLISAIALWLECFARLSNDFSLGLGEYGGWFGYRHQPIFRFAGGINCRNYNY